jgi:hypothetical protein
MTDTLSLGALEVDTQIYTTPADATKDKQYKCIDCNQKVIFRKGNVRRPHFAHYSPTNTCSYYEHPSEAQIHKDAKLLMAKLLTERKKIQFMWDCHHCKTSSDSYVFNDVSTISYRDGDEVITEYRGKDGTWIADVAVVNSGEVRYIIEIKNTHATTTTCRPEPWYEVVARDLIEYYEDPEFDQIRSNPDFIYMIPCVRQGQQRYCYGSFCYKEHWVKRIPGYDKTKMERCCVLCKTEEYEPVSDGSTGKFQNSEIRVCTPCLLKDTYEKQLRVMYMSVHVNKIIESTEVPKKVVAGCDGNGFCWVQDGSCTYIQKEKCPHNCKLEPCKSCGYMIPKKLLQIHNNKCMTCSIDSVGFIFLEVAFSRKDEVKVMGGKWNTVKKKWYIDRWAKNREEVLKKFKQSV